MTYPQTEQEIFDTVARHLLTQNKTAKRKLDDGTTCCYRTPDGLKCAVGCLIPDDVYSEDMESNDIERLIEALQARPSLRKDIGEDAADELADYLESHLKLLGDLQFLHDEENEHSWALCLTDIATDHHLDASVVKELRP